MEKSLPKALFNDLLRLLCYPAGKKAFRRLIAILLALAINRLPVRQALELLLEVENDVYSRIGPVAVEYGKGDHVKQRLTGYVDEFVSRAKSLNGPYLDVGCGKGLISARLAEKVSDKVVGVDKNKSYLRVADGMYRRSNLEFIHGDILSLTVESAFPTIILSNVLEHIEDRIDFLTLLRLRYRPQYILLRVPNFERDWRVPLKQELGVSYFSDSTHFVEHTPEQLYEEVTAAGWAIHNCDFRWGEIWAVLKIQNQYS